jgi:hypothetical protein
VVLYLCSFILFHGIVLDETQEQFCCYHIKKLFTHIPANQFGSFCEMFQQPQFIQMDHTLCVVGDSFHSNDCDVTQCSLVDISQSSGGVCCLQFQLLSSYSSLISYDSHILSFFLLLLLFIYI